MSIFKDDSISDWWKKQKWKKQGIDVDKISDDLSDKLLDVLKKQLKAL